MLRMSKASHIPSEAALDMLPIAPIAGISFDSEA